MKKYLPFLLLTMLMLLTLTGCVPGDGANSAGDLAGLFSGIWHGWIAPVSLVMSLFNGKYGIYEVNNNGFLYDLGFYAAIISGFGALSLTRKKDKHNH